MDWPTASREAMIAAFGLHEDLELDTFGRIDVFAAIAALGIRLTFRPLDSYAGFYVGPQESPPGIVINANQPLAMQRYTAAHELGHHVFGHDVQADRVDQGSAGVRRPGLSAEEKLAESFAAWFLMPPEAAEAVLRRLGLGAPSSPADVYMAALRLGVSYSALCTHLQSLKLADPRHATAWRARPLKQTKQVLSHSAPPGGWQNDVWRLTEEDAGHEAVVRAGDRLQFALAKGWPVSLDAGFSLADPAEPELFGGEPLTIDVASVIRTPSTLLRIDDGGKVLTYPIRVEFPRRGRYVPAGGVRDA